MTLGILHISHALPTRELTSETIAEKFGFELPFLTDKLGIATRRIAEPEQPTSDLCCEAGAKLLQETGLAPGQIGLVLVVTQTPDYCLPQVAALVQDRLGIPKTAAAFDISLGCSGFVYGLSVATAFMQAQGVRHGLLITGEEYSRLIDPSDRATAPLFGDGAAATLIGPNPVYAAGRYHFGTDGGRHEALIARGTGSRLGERKPLFMDGRAIFSFMMGEIPQAVDACLSANSLKREDIDCWIFHQASRYLLETIGSRMAIPAERLVIDLADIGNTTSSTIPIALERQVLRTAARPRNILVSGFGVGLSWATTVLHLQTRDSA